MAHNNSTPASVLTAPMSVQKPIALHRVEKAEVKKADGTTSVMDVGIKHEGPNVDPLTGVYRNPVRAQRKAKAAAKRRARNKHGKKGTRRG